LEENWKKDYTGTFCPKPPKRKGLGLKILAFFRFNSTVGIFFQLRATNYWGTKGIFNGPSRKVKNPIYQIPFPGQP